MRGGGKVGSLLGIYLMGSDVRASRAASDAKRAEAAGSPSAASRLTSLAIDDAANPVNTGSSGDAEAVAAAVEDTAAIAAAAEALAGCDADELAAASRAGCVG